jgi:transcriptional antiterminator RfaH
MSGKEAKWFAVYTKPRQERTAREQLARQGFECFLPMAVNPYQRRSRLHTPRIEPLFPRYLFLNAVVDQQSLGPVRSTLGVSNLVRFGTELAIVPQRVIGMIKNRFDSKTGLVKLEPVPVELGDRVRVFDGPLAGVEGIFRERKGSNRALLLMRLLGVETTVEVDSLMLKKAM